MEITLLKSINIKFEHFAFENNYEYDLKEHITGGNARFNAITINQSILPLKDFVHEITMKNFTKEQFFNVIKKQLEKDNNYALLDVDLYNWLEGSVCWQKYHWHHYTLLVDYNNDNHKFRVFDERKGQYIEFFIDEDKLYNCIAFNEGFKSKLRLITLYENYSIKRVTLDKIVLNAKKIIDGLSNSMNKEFWLLPENDYIAKSFIDLSGIYLQRIEGRQKGNASLIKMMREKNILNYEKLIKYQNTFHKLSYRWKVVRIELYKLYFNVINREIEFVKLNENIRKCLNDEYEVWRDFIDYSEKYGKLSEYII